MNEYNSSLNNEAGGYLSLYETSINILSGRWSVFFIDQPACGIREEGAIIYNIKSGRSEQASNQGQWSPSENATTHPYYVLRLGTNTIPFFYSKIYI